MIMKYKSLEFPKNPSTLEIKASSLTAKLPIISKRSAVQNISEEPAYIKACGVLYSQEGEQWSASMKALVGDKKSGWLFTPGAPPMRAFLSSFTFKRNSRKNEIEYCAEFLEDCSEVKPYANIKYAYAKKGENAFDIAYRCGMSVDELEELNGYISPFDIKENDRMVIR